MVVSLKVPLFPTKEQIVQFHNMSNAYHNLQNRAVEYIKNTDGFIKENDIRNYLSEFCDDSLPLGFVITVIAKEKHLAFKNHSRNRVKFKKYYDNRKSFPVRCDANGNRLSRLYSNDGEYIKIPSINGVVKMSRIWVNKMKRKFGDSFCDGLLNMKKQTARVVFDGKYWYLIFSYNSDIYNRNLKDDSIGVDVGIKNLAVTSDGDFISGVNKSKEVLRLVKKLKYLQRTVSNKYRQNKSYNKTKNIRKLEYKIYLIYRRLKNIRENELHHISKMLVDKNYSSIVFENLNIKGMLKNKRLAKSISNQCWYKLMQYTKYKAEFYGQLFKQIERFRPSSKECSNCGNIKRNLLLSDRIYRCDICGLVIDRDLNAAINIKNFGTC